MLIMQQARIWFYQSYFKPVDHFEPPSLEKKKAGQIAIRAHLFNTHGFGDEGFVLLQLNGWAEIMENVMQLELLYEDGTCLRPVNITF